MAADQLVRVSGYYWLKTATRWIIAYYHQPDNHFEVIGSTIPVTPDDERILEICENPIIKTDT
jgi:hypothetical protein